MSSEVAEHIAEAICQWEDGDAPLDEDWIEAIVDSALKDYGLTQERIDLLQQQLQAERDCVLRQQRELNKREGEFICCNCGDKQWVTFHDIKDDRTMLARAYR